MRQIRLAATAALLLTAALAPANAREQSAGQWEANSATVRAWFRELMQPDNPTVSCCGEADAYWSDSFVVVDGKTVAIITDTRDDAPLGRPPRPNGSRFVVPDHKLKFDAGNPTGHGVLFLNFSGDVLCYVTPGGV